MVDGKKSALVIAVDTSFGIIIITRNKMAFVSGFHGAQVGENKSAAVCTTAPTKAVRNGDVSMAMVRKETRGRRTLAFNYRKNNVDTMIESGKKITTKADEFFARSVTMQYKAFACPNGEYTTQCREGSVKQEAFEKRAMALSAQFRARQASPAAKARAIFENRRHAIIAAGGCDHEEKLFTRFPQLSAAYTHGQTEAEANQKGQDEQEARVAALARSFWLTPTL